MIHEAQHSSCWSAHDEIRHRDIGLSIIILQDAPILTAASKSNLWQVLCVLTRSCQRTRYARAKLKITDEHLLGGALLRHTHNMTQTSYPPSLCHHQDIRLIVHSTANPWFILRLHKPCSNTPPNSCEIYLHSMCDFEFFYASTVGAHRP